MSPHGIGPELPRAESRGKNDHLTDEDVTEIFFSFDITATAFLWEHQRGGHSDFSVPLVPLSSPPGDFAGLGPLLFSNVRDCLRKKTTYGYFLLILLLSLLTHEINPTGKGTIERITALFAPEFSVPRPAPPPVAKPVKPETRPEPEPEKVQKRPKPKAPPPPQPPKEKPMRTIRKAKPKPLQPIVKRPTKPPQPQRMAEDPALRIRNRSEKTTVEKSRLKISTGKRATASETGGLKVRAARRADVAGDLPTAFGKVRKDSRETAGNDRLSTVGIRPKKVSDLAEEKTPLSVEPVRRQEPAEEPAAATGLPRHGHGRDDARADEAFSGTWQRIENIGPLAQLNALCYGRHPGETVYDGPYRLTCKNNQIIEAWRKVSIP